MLILKVISRLLDYPTEEMFSAKDELIAIVEKTTELTEKNRKVKLIDEWSLPPSKPIPQFSGQL